MRTFMRVVFFFLNYQIKRLPVLNRNVQPEIQGNRAKACKNRETRKKGKKNGVTSKLHEL